MNQEKGKNGIDLSRKLRELTQEFQNERWSPNPYISSTTPKIIRWLIKYSGGLIKNERQATYLLLGFIVFIVVISLFLIFSRGGESKREKTFAPPAEAPVEEVIPPAEF